MKTPKAGRAARAARLPLSEVRALLARQEASGLSLSAFGRREGLPFDRLANYRRRRRLAQGEPARKSARPADTAQPAGFVRLEPLAGLAVPAAADTATVFIHCPGGARIEVRRGFDPTLLLDLVRLLQTAPQVQADV
ncbi:MAG: IS66 family insertion sequence element accessory protein TnpA [Rhodanobacteraceae bacterium]